MVATLLTVADLARRRDATLAGRLSCFRLSAGTRDPLTDVAGPDRIAPGAGDPLGAT